MTDEHRHSDYSEHILLLDEATTQKQPKAAQGEGGRGFKEIHPAPQIDVKRGSTRHEPLYPRAQEQPQHKPALHQQPGAVDPASIQPPAAHAPHSHGELLPVAHASAKGGTKAAPFWSHSLNYISRRIGLMTPVVTSPPETAVLPKLKPPPGIPPVAAAANGVPEGHQRQHGTSAKAHHMSSDSDVLEVQLEHRSDHPTLGHLLPAQPKDPHVLHVHHGHTPEGNTHGSREQMKTASHRVAHQAADAHPPPQLHPTASSGHHHGSAEGFQHSRPLLGPLAVVKPDENHQHYMHHHRHSAGPMDAWVDTDLIIPPYAADADLARRLSDVPPRVLIDHYLGKSRGPHHSPFHATLVAFLRVAQSACLAFILLAVVFLCLAVFYTIGEYPIETSSPSPAKTEIFHMPTVILTETANTADSTDSFLDSKLAAEPSTAGFHPERARNAVSNDLSAWFVGGFTEGLVDVKTAELASDSVHVVTVSNPDEDSVYSTEEGAPQSTYRVDVGRH